MVLAASLFCCGTDNPGVLPSVPWTMYFLPTHETRQEWLDGERSRCCGLTTSFYIQIIDTYCVNRFDWITVLFGSSNRDAFEYNSIAKDSDTAR